ncbi:YacL family protein [Rheinheimera sp. MMS21-TC3]|uniref:YacL family protein n=1 Tax=Rheinheimera sp. MMS21-TC3 TaxID=3072790 RepID=UPI0028C4D640|nr:YacL family protein [Rheinheimera sp. MMS21-TC3]WNO61721.1 YacL family protein [Rheinheimera sp. MMS21-TC3]
MEYDFTYQRDTGQYGLVLAPEYQILANFLLEEFAADATAVVQLIQQLKALTPFNDWRYQGKEFVLDVQQLEVMLQHNSLLHDHNSTTEQQLLLEEQLQLDEHGLSCHCGLEDLLKLLQDWQQFIAV